MIELWSPPIFYNKGVKTISNVEFTMSPYHVLWPIPASTINSNTKGHINQNKGICRI